MRNRLYGSGPAFDGYLAGRAYELRRKWMEMAREPGISDDRKRHRVQCAREWHRDFMQLARRATS